MRPTLSPRDPWGTNAFDVLRTFDICNTVCVCITSTKSSAVHCIVAYVRYRQIFRYRLTTLLTFNFRTALLFLHTQPVVIGRKSPEIFN